MLIVSVSRALDPALFSRKYSQWKLATEKAHIILMASPLFSHSEAINTLIFRVCFSKWSLSNINNVLLAERSKQLPLSYWKNFVFGKLLQTEHHSVFSSLVIRGLMNELTNERGFACLGLSLRGRLISIQYAKLLRTQDFIQALAFTLQTQWSALRPLGPSLILQDPVVNILRLIHLSSQINY